MCDIYRKLYVVQQESIKDFNSGSKSIYKSREKHIMIYGCWIHTRNKKHFVSMEIAKLKLSISEASCHIA
jgi:hypothetical protein